MKVLKLIAGILCIICSVFLTLPYVLADPYDSVGFLRDASQAVWIGGIAGVAAAAVLFVCGVLMLTTRKSRNVGGDVLLMILLTLAVVAGAVFAGGIPVLWIWAGVFLALALLNLISLYAK